MIARLQEKGGVPRLRGDVAGDVDHPGRRNTGNGPDHSGIQTLTRRIQHDDIGAEPFADEPGKTFLGFACIKGSVLYSVPLGVALRVFHGGRNNFDSDSLPAVGSHHERDGSRAAVYIAERVFRLQLGEGEGCLIELFRLGRIDLEKGSGRQLEAQAAKRVRQRLRAIKQMEAVGKDDVGPVPVFVQPQADNAQRTQAFDQFIRGRQPTAVGRDSDHTLSPAVDADDEMTDQAPVGFLLIGLHPEAFHPCQKSGGDSVGLRHGVGAGCDGDDGVASRREKAQDGIVNRSGGGEGCFVAVARGVIHSENRRDIQTDAGNPFKAILNLNALGLQRGIIGHMTAAASAAAGENGAIRLLPAGGGNQRITFHAPEGVAFLHLHNADVCRFSGKQPGDKDGQTLVAADALQIGSELFGCQLKTIILLHGASPIRFNRLFSFFIVTGRIWLVHKM